MTIPQTIPRRWRVAPRATERRCRNCGQAHNIQYCREIWEALHTQTPQRANAEAHTKGEETRDGKHDCTT
jgi:hypothetical protein